MQPNESRSITVSKGIPEPVLGRFVVWPYESGSKRGRLTERFETALKQGPGLIQDQGLKYLSNSNT